MMKKAYGSPSPSVPASTLLALLRRKKGVPLSTLKPKASFAARLEALVEFARGDLALPEIARNGLFGGKVTAPSSWKQGIDVLKAARAQGSPGSAQQRIRAMLAQGIIKNRQAKTVAANGQRYLTAF